MEINIIHNEHTITDPTITNTINIIELAGLTNDYTTIFIGDLLNFFSLSEIVPILHQIKTKLIPGGMLIIEEYDQFEICSEIANNRLLSTDYNNIIGPRKLIFTVPDIIDILNKSGFKVIQKDIDNLKHLIKSTI